ncbi:VanZ family protein [Lachnospiraceae bacterium KM106-2]|nr:VanZ family protein [Lachnospiraceae bacterium KM106-2]
MMKHKAAINRVGWCLFIIYIAVMAYFLFFSERYGRTIGTGIYRYNLEPLKEIKRFIQYRQLIGWESFIVNILGNIFAFSPFGFFLPMLCRKTRHWFHITLLSFELSLCIETLQLATKLGIFDVDDLIMNTIGGLVGYIIFAISYRLVRSTAKGARRRG